MRLVPAASLMWGAALLGLVGDWWVAAVCGGCAAAAAVVGMCVAARRRASRTRTSCVALLLCALVGTGSLTSRLAAAEHDPLRPHAARGADAVARVTVTERPRPIRSSGYGARPARASSVVLTGEVRGARVAGRTVDTDAEVVLIAQGRGWADLRPGQVVTARGGLAQADRATLTAAVLYVRAQPGRVRPPPWWQRAAAELRAGLHRASSVLGHEPAGLLPGLVTGDTSKLAQRVDSEFEAAGMAHLTAVSGSNITVICGVVLLVLRTLRVGPRTSAATAGLALLGFVVVVGPEPSVLRAGVMGAVGLLALALGRNRSAIPALAVAVLCLVCYDPAMATSFGFALSVSATAGIVLLAPRWSRAVRRAHVPRAPAAAVAVAAAAFVATAPIVAAMSGRVSAVSIPANVLVTPVLPPVTILGVLAMLLATVWPDSAELLVRLAGPGLEWLIRVAREAAAVPGAVVTWPSGWWGGLLAGTVAVGLFVLARWRSGRVMVAAAVLAALLVLVPVRVSTPSWPPAAWSFAACDVGQGDGLVLATGRPGEAVVVDAGPRPARMDRCLDALDVERVPLVVLSHLHTDHIGGLRGVFRDRAVGAVATGPGRTPSWAWRRVRDETTTARVPLRALRTGQRMRWPALRLEVLGPRHVPSRAAVADDAGTAVNNASVVLRAGTPAGRVLLTGDVELSAQADLLAADVELDADILKVPHHGSGVFLPRFLTAVSPRASVVSVGADNDYGHPSERVLHALRGAGALVARTDTAGDVVVRTEHGDPVIVRRQRPPAP